MIPSKSFILSLTNPEKEVLQVFDRQEARFFILEWHRRAYKTTLLINMLITEACRNPMSKYVYVAPTEVWARNVVWDDPVMLWGSLPDKKEFSWNSNEQKKMVTFQNGSILKICGSDDPDSIRGIDFDGAGLDEYSLHKPQTWNQILEPIARGGRKPNSSRPRWVMFLYTPKGHNHATQLFNAKALIEDESTLPTCGRSVKSEKDWFISRLDGETSNIIPQEEILAMKQQVDKGLTPLSFYEQEIRCKRVTDEERTLITSAMLDRLSTVRRNQSDEVVSTSKKIVAIDPAFGGDICSIKGFDNYKEVVSKVVRWTLTSEVIFEAKMIAQEIGTTNFIVDCIGNGKGVADGLYSDAAGYNVQYFQSAGGKGLNYDNIQFANRKIEAIFYVSGLIRQCKVAPIADVETRRQLVALSRYKIQPGSGKMISIPNDEVKKLIGCSPDKGLCYIYGIYGSQFVDNQLVSSHVGSNSENVFDPNPLFE